MAQSVVMPLGVAHLHSDPTGENRGQFQHRVQNPIDLFTDDPEFHGFGLSIFEPEFEQVALEADLLIVHEVIRPELELLMVQRRALARPTLYEIADHILALGSWLPQHHSMHSPINRSMFLHLAALSDGIVFSSHALEQEFAFLNPVHGVLDNWVTFPNPRPKPSEFVFGWAGTTTHLKDLASVMPEIKVFCQRHPDVKFAVMGNRSAFAPLVADIPSHQLEVYEFGSYTDYLEFLQGLHVGLAPLLPSGFNRGRTDVKFMEYSVCGVASILANHRVYQQHAAHSALFNDGADLLAALEHLYAHPEIREAQVQRAVSWVHTHRTRHATKMQHRRFYHRMLSGKIPSTTSQTPQHSHHKTELREAWQARGVQHHQQAWHLAQHLYQGIPTWYQAAYLMVLSLQSLEQYHEVLDVTRTFPKSIYSPLIAEIAYQAAQKVSPEQANFFVQHLSPPARSRLEAKTLSPDRQFEMMLHHHPYDFFALHGMVHWLEPSDPRRVVLRQRLALFEPVEDL